MTAKRAISATLVDSRHFLQSLLHTVRAELTSSLTRDLHGTEARMGRERILRLFDYTMADGKFARSSLAFNTYKVLTSPTTSEDQFHAAGKVALTLELLQTFFLIEDDIMDRGERRRGKPCWHTLPDIGMSAINDGLLLDCGIDNVIRHAIPSHPRMHAILHDIAEAKQKSVVGQMLDADTKDLSEFTSSRYAAIVEHKTSHYSYYLPLIIGLHLADHTSPSLTKLRQMAYRIGHLFQAQDDYLDCFGDPAVTGKSNLSDLAEGKCTWVTCALVEKLTSNKMKQNPAKLDTFRANFGFESGGDPEKLAVSRQILLEEGIPHQFEQYQQRFAEKLHDELCQVAEPELRDLLHSTVDGIVNRQK